MTIKQFKVEYRLVNDGDAWGTAMGAWFECAAQLNKRKYPTPTEWNYSPGMVEDATDKDNYWHVLFSQCSNKQLLAIGNLLYRLTNILEKAGLSY